MNHLARMIDANHNRAAEAARVLEDIARFGLADATHTEALKGLRHTLRAALDGSDGSGGLGLPEGMGVAWRDTPRDPGTAIHGQGEYARQGVIDVAEANASRLGEALRALEESAKALGAPGAARRIEAIRYSGYDLGSRLIAGLGTGRARQWALCVLLTESLCAGRDWLGVARACIEGGADCLQLREKSLEGAELLARTRALVVLARPAGVAVIVNDRPDIALAGGADGVHLGQGDLPVQEARKVVGRALLIGVSTSCAEEAIAARRGGADYCGIGPMFDTTTKHKPVLAGPEALRRFVAEPALAGLPHLAIGGITPANIAHLAAVGGRGVAVSGAVCGAPDPAAVCRELRAALPPVRS